MAGKEIILSTEATGFLQGPCTRGEFGITSIHEITVELEIIFEAQNFHEWPPWHYFTKLNFTNASFVFHRLNFHQLSSLVKFVNLWASKISSYMVSFFSYFRCGRVHTMGMGCLAVIKSLCCCLLIKHYEY